MGKETRTKIIRKSTRALVSLLSRSSSRSTPSRIMGTVGELHSDSNSQGITLSNTSVLLASRRQVRVSDSAVTPHLLRWNPSAITFGSRSYITAPRKATTDTLSSVGMNPLLENIRVLSCQGVSLNQLIEAIQEDYSDISYEIIENFVRQLIDKEFLLTEADEGYHTYRQERRIVCKRLDLNSNNLSLSFDEEAGSLDVDLYRNAEGQLPEALDETVIAYLNHGFSHGIFSTNDSEISSIFAELVLEKYGASRVPVTHLIHPLEGISWRTIRKHQGSIPPASTSYHRAVYDYGVATSTGWVDLRQVEDMLPTTGKTYRNFDSADIIASLHGNDDSPVFCMADAISNISAGVTTARFDLIDDNSLEDVTAVNIDWISDQAAFNSVRESSARYTRTINVNSFYKHAQELTIDQLQIWSDGTDVYVCDVEGNPVKFRPTSMAGLGSYPEWLMQIAMADIAHTPNLNWDWGEIKNNVNYLPGVRYRDLILSRPAYRYSGSYRAEDFNDWANSRGLTEWVRIGNADKKVLIKRNSGSFKELLEAELRKGDGWIYSTFDEELTPLSSDKEGNKVFTEISRTYLVSSPHKSSEELKQVAQKLAVVVPSSSREIIPLSTEFVNLVITPQEGFYDRVLAALFSQQSLNTEMYFVRYPSATGEKALRLRFLRDSSQVATIRQTIIDLSESGYLLDIVEEPHSFEFERYGGESVFPLFRNLAVLESNLVVFLSNNHNQILEKNHLALLNWWLDLFPIQKEKIIKFAIEDQVIEGPTSNEASLILRSLKTDISSFTIPSDIQRHMYFLAQKISAESSGTYELQSAAHLFCNRLGITTDREKSLWLSLYKVLKRKNNENKVLD